MKNSLLLYLILLCFVVSAQRQADSWAFGLCLPEYIFPGCTPPYGSSIMKFNEDGVEAVIEPAGLNLSTDYSRASFSDKHTGDLLFASNGWRLVNRSGQVLAHKLWRSDIPHPNDTPDTTAVLNSLGPLFLDEPGDDTKAYLFYGQYRVVNLPGIGFARLDVLFTYAYLDIPTQSLISKNNVILTDTTAPGDMSACRHANGRDWWLFKSGKKENEVYVGVLNPQGIQMQKRILPSISDSIQASTFSYFNQNGDKYIHYSGSGLRRVYAFDFDRCSGELSNMQMVDLKDSIWRGDWTQNTISPDGSKFYFRRSPVPGVGDGKGGFFQVDLAIGTIKKIYTGAAQITPNYKNLIFPSFHPDSVNQDFIHTYSLVMNPDLPYNQINISWHIDTLQNAFNSVAPNTFANFRLGKLAGSPCDTIVSNVPTIQTREVNISLYPNPARDILYLEFPYPNGKPYQISIVDVMGKVVYSSTFAAEGGSLSLAQLGLSKGLYVLHAQRDGKGYSRRFVYEK